MGVEIEGIPEILQLLDDLPKEIMSLGYLRALQAGGGVLKGAIEEAAPVKKEDTGGLLEPGELRKNVGIEIQLDSNLRGGIATVGFYKAVANVPLWVEYGHAIVGKFIGQVPEHPFIRPAFDASVDNAIEAALDSLKTTIKGEYEQEAA